MCHKPLILGLGLFLGAGAAAASHFGDAVVEDELLLHKVLGTASCATSGCHGGAGLVHGAVATFRREDPHARSYETLATPRSARMGEALGIADVRTSASCTVCHAPVASVPEGLRGEDLRVEDGVGCASCHDSAESWLRTHTRPELDHSAKVAAGMRDLRSAYARANACVACHQVIEPRLVETGRHPRLIFELDGQLAAEPAHWREVHGWDGAKAWLVGQAVAWREAGAAHADGRDTMVGAAEREAALAWLVARAGGAGAAGSAADAVARRLDADWPAGEGEAVLRRLAGVGDDFRATGISRLEQAYRAERLVLGLDRVLAAWPERARAKAAEPVLARLFTAAQSVPEFQPAGFANLLDELARVVGGAG
jgi:hypothetical protein